MKYIGYLLLFLLFYSPSIYAGGKFHIIDDFEDGLKPDWKTKEFNGKTIYKVVKEGDNHVLKAVSNNSASVLIYRYNYYLKEYPILSWRWKVENIIQKGDATKKEGDDYSARIYVIFTHRFPSLTKAVNYIWANKLLKGNYIQSTYYSNDIMVAVESGEENIGKWIIERRNIYNDFKRIFGSNPPEVKGIAIMTDTDNTGESATAYYDDIRIERLY